ncbi:hypothetical protein ACFX11_030500 [Malus domestica]
MSERSKRPCSTEKRGREEERGGRIETKEIKRGQAQGGATREGKGGGPTSQKEREKEKLRKKRQGKTLGAKEKEAACRREAMRNQILANVSSWGCLSLLPTMRTRLKDPCIRKGSQNDQRAI